jgi:hypothetical protein
MCIVLFFSIDNVAILILSYCDSPYYLLIFSNDLIALMQLSTLLFKLIGHPLTEINQYLSNVNTAISILKYFKITITKIK